MSEIPLQVVVHSPAPSAAASPAEAGLSSSDVINLRAKHGWNEVPKKKKSKILMFFKHFWGLSAWMLEAVIIASLALRAWVEAAVPAILLLVNAVLGYIQETRAASAIDALTDRLHIESRVLRDGRWTLVPAKELVPGDTIKLRDGDVIPAGERKTKIRLYIRDLTQADVTVLAGHAEVDQAALTGESEAVAKAVGDTAYAGTIITSGEILCKVASTGARTKFGVTAELIGSSEPKIHAQSLLKRLVYIIIGLAGGLVIIVLIVVCVRRQNVPKVIPLLLSTLVSAMPVALPAMLTITMALGTRRLGKVGALVSRLAATEDAARMTVLFSDKTGTITQNRLRVTAVEPLEGVDPSEVLLAAALSSRAENKDPIDSAVLTEKDRIIAMTTAHGKLDSYSQFKLLKFVPFSAATRCTESTVEQADGSVVVVRKGAVPTLLAQCRLSAAQREWAEAAMLRHAASGERTIAVTRSVRVVKPLPSEELDSVSKGKEQAVKKEEAKRSLEAEDKSDEKHKKRERKRKDKKAKKEEDRKVTVEVNDKPKEIDKEKERIEPVELRVRAVDMLEFLGIIALADPPREDSKEAIAKIRGYGVRVVMLTGDSLPIARYVASLVGLDGQIESLAAWRKKLREELQPDEHDQPHAAANSRRKYTSVLETPMLEEATGFAEVFPEDKHAFVKQLQQRKQVVGMTGDGVNDAPALKQAEVGVAVSNATDVAKKAASVVLIPEGLAPIASLIEEGRRIHSRLVTWLFNYVSKTFQATAFVLVMYLITKQFPLHATHILMLLLFHDFLTLCLSADNARMCTSPAKWHLLRIVVIAAIVGLMSFGESVALYYFGRDYLEFYDDYLSTYCFEMMFFFSTVNVFVARERRFFFSSLPFWLLPAVIAVGTIAVVILCSFNVRALHIRALPLRHQLTLYALAITTRFIINDPIKYVLFRLLLPQEQ